MKNENLIEYGMLNDEIVEQNVIEEKLKTKKTKVYDVLRLINSKPLYLEDHLSRLNRSIKLAGYKKEILEMDFKKGIEKLVVKSGRTNNNIKTTYFEDEESVRILYMVESKYPSKEKGADEVIFLTENKVVLECSRSNLFFVKGEKIITSPDERVLLGTTRQKILKICENNNISILKREIMLDELNFFDTAFVTGNSIDIMPLNRIDSVRYNTGNKVIKKLTDYYSKEKMRYLKNYKRA